MLMNDITLEELIKEAGMRKLGRMLKISHVTVLYWIRDGLPRMTTGKADRRRAIERALAKATGRPVAEVRAIARQDDLMRGIGTPPEDLPELIRFIGTDVAARGCGVSYSTANRWIHNGLPKGLKGTPEHTRRRHYERELARMAGMDVADLRKMADDYDRKLTKPKGRKVDMGTATGVMK